MLKAVAISLIGAVLGVTLQLNWYVRHAGFDPLRESILVTLQRGDWQSHSMNLRLGVGTAMGVFLIWLLVLLFRRILRIWIQPSSDAYRQILRWELLALFPLLIPVTTAWGIFIPPIFSFGATLLIFAFLILRYKASGLVGQQLRPRNARLLGLFFVSGFAALIYQITWQRSIFLMTGVNSESVAVVVAVFMFGLGMGGLMGGLLARLFPKKALVLFATAELGIAVCGFFSLAVIEHMMPAHSLSQSDLLFHTFKLLFIPTLLMGATLPILIEHLRQQIPDLTRTVGLLYCLNTLGSGVAAFLTVHCIFVVSGLSGATRIAAMLNVLVTIGAFWTQRVKMANAEEQRNADTQRQVIPVRGKFIGAVGLMIITGFISLAAEILWFRTIDYFMASRSFIFGDILGFFLTGIALGAYFAKRVQVRYNLDNRTLVFYALLAESGVLYITPPLCAQFATFFGEGALIFFFASVLLFAFISGLIFPLLMDYGLSGVRNAGAGAGLLYFANIVGSTLGPLIIGQYLLNHYKMESLFQLQFIFVLLIASWGLSLWKNWRIRVFQSAALVVFILLVLHGALYSHFFEKLFYKHNYQGQGFVKTIQNKHSVINQALSEDLVHRDDIIIGGGAYDGRFNIDPTIDRNAITRAYAIAIFHKDPQRILEIGLAGGAWAQVMLAHEKVQSLTSVEINPGYVELIRSRPDFAPLLSDPRLKIIIDDGRRWLRNTTEKFDLIVMNTTFHWRSMGSYLLSRELFAAAKARLRSGGVLYVNATGSPDVVKTVSQLFPYVVRYSSLLAASEQPFSMTESERRENLLLFRFNGKSVFMESPEHVKSLNGLVATQLENIAPLYAQNEALYVVTDDNLATEYKSGNYLYFPSRAWLPLVIDATRKRSM